VYDTQFFKKFKSLQQMAPSKIGGIDSRESDSTIQKRHNTAAFSRIGT